MFNSLKYAKILEDAGLPRNQAETHIQILSDVIGEEMATKDDIRMLGTKVKNDLERFGLTTKEDLQSLESRIQNNMRTLESKVSDDIRALETKMTYEFQNLEQRMTLKLGGLMAAFLATGLTAAKLLFI